MQEKILEMLKLQNTLNNETNGDKWRLGKTNKGKTINWHTAILLEGSEAIDSTPWKHWKNISADIDLDNIRIELVDIYHFLMSQYLISNEAEELSFIIESQLLELSNETKKIKYENFNFLIKKLVYESLKSEIEEKEYDVLMSMKIFVSLMNEINMSFEDLYKIYISKNVLNKFRQENGYKEGTYKKEWNGVEDNVVLTEIINKLDYIDYDILFNKLKEEYKKIN